MQITVASCTCMTWCCRLSKQKKGFRKEDFRVQVDGAGRLTVRGQRADGSKHVHFHKVFQLPPTSNLDDISGRFDAGVLSLTVPKRPPATIDDIRKPTKPKEEEEEEAEPTPQVQGKDEAKKAEQHNKEQMINNKPEEKKAEQHKEETAKKKPTKEEDARKKAAADEKKIKEEEMEAKIKKAAAAEQMKAEVEAKQRSKAEQEHKREEEGKPKPAERGPTETKAVDRDSILERMRRRAEEERAKAAAAEDHKKQMSGSGGWKQRVTEELQGLRSSEWAEGMVETVKKNKEGIAAAVAAFSLGLFVSSRLFNRN